MRVAILFAVCLLGAGCRYTGTERCVRLSEAFARESSPELVITYVMHDPAIHRGEPDRLGIVYSDMLGVSVSPDEILAALKEWASRSPSERRRYSTVSVLYHGTRRCDTFVADVKSVLSGCGIQVIHHGLTVILSTGRSPKDAWLEGDMLERASHVWRLYRIPEKDQDLHSGELHLSEESLRECIADMLSARDDGYYLLLTRFGCLSEKTLAFLERLAEKTGVTVEVALDRN